MKVAAKGLLLLAAISAAAAYGQDPTKTQGTVKHVIVIVQENRTVDNLFGSNPTFETTGVNITNVGLNGSASGGTTTLTALPLNDCYDLGHSHEDFLDMWANGKMNGAWDVMFLPDTDPTCTAAANPNAAYRFAQNDAGTDPQMEVQPYFEIAEKYGFANYMFQTNQGPSFPAHQFLFSGTSAPVYEDNLSGNFWEYFAAENPATGVDATGCFGAYGSVLTQISPTGQEMAGWKNPGLLNATAGYPCYNHNTIADVLDNAVPQVTWKYYTNNPVGLWTAPNTIQKICNATDEKAGTCAAVTGVNTDWNNVIQEPSTTNNPAQIISDITNTNCSALANVSFVTPDGAWSDHAGCNFTNGCQTVALGPAWVAAIVNAVGASSAPGTCGYWNNTVILITWDDWGGWYDHVSPPSTTGYSGGNGNGKQYVYGLRVPLLVVSGYTKAGYVSGSASSNAVTTCPTSPTIYCHDFGSILNFIEYAFGTNGKSLPEIDSSNYHYADHWALDGPNECVTCPYSLSDFFNFNLKKPNSFQKITTPITNENVTLDANYFMTYTGTVQPPDLD